jgi:hypothetical protein
MLLEDMNFKAKVPYHLEWWMNEIHNGIVFAKSLSIATIVSKGNIQ